MARLYHAYVFNIKSCWRLQLFFTCIGCACFILPSLFRPNMRFIPPETNEESMVTLDCVSYDSLNNFPKNPRAWDVILSQHSHHTSSLINDLLRADRNVLLITSKMELMKHKDIVNDFGRYEGVVEKHRNQVRFIDVDQLAHDLLVSKNENVTIANVHVLLSRSSFSPTFPAKHNVNVLHVLVDLLLWLSRRRFDHIYFHTPQVRNIESQNVPVMQKCDYQHDYKQFEDVFLKTLDIYLYTFQKLYDFKVTHVVHS